MSADKPNKLKGVFHIIDRTLKLVIGVESEQYHVLPEQVAGEVQIHGKWYRFVITHSHPMQLISKHKLMDAVTTLLIRDVKARLGDADANVIFMDDFKYDS